MVQKGDTNLAVTRLTNYFDDTEKLSADDGMFFAFTVKNFAKEAEGKFIEPNDYHVLSGLLYTEISDQQEFSHEFRILETHICTEKEIA